MLGTYGITQNRLGIKNMLFSINKHVTVHVVTKYSQFVIIKDHNRNKYYYKTMSKYKY